MIKKIEVLVISQRRELFDTHHNFIILSLPTGEINKNGEEETLIVISRFEGYGWFKKLTRHAILRCLKTSFGITEKIGFMFLPWVKGDDRVLANIQVSSLDIPVLGMPLEQINILPIKDGSDRKYVEKIWRKYER